MTVVACRAAWSALLGVCALWLASPLAASADATSAEPHVAEGERAYDAGDYDQAQREFEQALELLTKSSVETAASEVETATPIVVLVAPQEQPVAVPEAPAASPVDATLPVTGVAPYTIGVGDVLSISVWQVADLSREATVRPDGKISYPLVGDVPAEGVTLTELTRMLTDRLRQFVREPQVSIELKTMAQQRLVILGEVNKQGIHPFPGRTTTVPEAIGFAEGFKRIGAKIKDVAVLKGYPRQPQLYHVDVKTLLSQGYDPQRLILTGGDIVFVSRSWVGNAHAFIDATTPMLNSVFQGISAYSLYENLPNNRN